MSNAVKQLKQRINNERNNNKSELQMVKEQEQQFNEKYNNPDRDTIKALIDEHIANGTVYKAKDHDEAFKYIHDMKYSIDIIATYQSRGLSKFDKGRTICIVDIYVLVRETGECIWVDHAWLHEGLCISALKYYLQYKDTEGQEVFINRLKAMKYGANYRKNGNLECRYQISSLQKHKRVLWVKRQQKAVGIEMSDKEIRAML